MERIPVFMANLSSKVEQFNNEIAPADVKVIVEMLLQVTDVSQNTTIDKLVMNVIHFLFLSFLCVLYSFYACCNHEFNTQSCKIRFMNTLELPRFLY